VYSCDGLTIFFRVSQAWLDTDLVGRMMDMIVSIVMRFRGMRVYKFDASLIDYRTGKVKCGLSG
jgi:predicted site-specific integrase-resolvase